MKIGSVNLKILIGFVIAAFGIGFFLIITYSNSQNSLVDSKDVRTELAIMKATENLLDELQDIESSYRGFLVTGRKNYLKPYTIAIPQVDKNLKEIEINSAKHKYDSALIVQLNVLTKEKIKCAQQIVDMRGSGRNNEAYAVFASGREQFLMDSIRTIILILETNGRTVLNASNRNKEILANQTQTSFELLAVIILVVLSIFYTIINRDLKNAEESKIALTEANEKIQDLYDHAPCGYLTTDEQFLITQINRTALNWLGVESQEIINKQKVTDLIRISDTIDLNSFVENEGSNLEALLKKNVGIETPILIDFIEKKGEETNKTEYRFILTDIQAKKAAELQLNYMADLINQTSDAIISTDKDFFVKSWNKGAERLYGYSSEETINVLVKDIVKPLYTEEYRAQLIYDLSKYGFWKGEVTHHKKDGTRVYIIGSVTPIKNNLGEVTGYVSTNQDISARMDYEKKLERFNKKLMQMVEEKTAEITDTLERVTEGFFSLDSEFRISYVNNMGASIMNKTRAELMGNKFTDQFPEAKDTIFYNTFVKAYENQKALEVEAEYKNTSRYFNTRAYPSEKGVSVFVAEVTGRKLNELKIIESEKKYRRLFESNPFPMWLVDSDTLHIIDVNQSAVNHYGYSKEEFFKMRIPELLLSTKESNLTQKQGIVNEIYSSETISHKKKSGEQIKVELFYYTINIDFKNQVIIVANDVTEKVRSQIELQNSRDQLRQLSIYLEKIREDERTSISREIHDELGQQLTSMKMDISWISKRLNGDSTQIQDRIQIMLKLIDSTVNTVRRIASDLRPGMLDDLGLAAALDWQSREFEKRTGIRSSFSTNIADQEIDKAISTGFFRIFQEALTNVARHANATEVQTQLYSDTIEIKLKITDNGTGISENTMNKKTLGLLGMRERALMIGANLTIQSQPGSGTVIELTIPFIPKET